ncbi:MAG: hypothetical protein ACM3TR_18555 [Caulobacteraceae bacterium]
MDGREMGAVGAAGTAGVVTTFSNCLTGMISAGCAAGGGSCFLLRAGTGGCGVGRGGGCGGATGTDGETYLLE